MRTTLVQLAVCAACAGARADTVRTWEGPHARLVEVRLQDATDAHDELYFETERTLSACEARFKVTAPVFFVEDALTGAGTAFVRLGPLPHARADKRPDAEIDARKRTVTIFDTAYPFAERRYTGGRAGRMRAAHDIQRDLRPYVSGRDGMFLTNTWGDGNRDARLNEAFMLGEVEAGARLGVDVIQIDDGWQKGRTANSAALAKGEKGRWGSFWDVPGFWDVDPARFPNGLDGIVRAARARGMKFGLWFGPDSSDEAAQWEKDAAKLLELHRAGIDYFKLDSMKSVTPRALARQKMLMDALMERSARKITIDLDVTAGVRPGYFGFPEIGPLFVENRYARANDARLWWPHRTLRNLWSLAQVVDPVRLRMEVLNPERNPACWGDDPLAPAAYPKDTLFAMVMAASPLGWFEIQNLSPATVEAWRGLVAVWKRERDAWYGGRILPALGRPDGVAWTGFVSVGADGNGYALVFRELNAAADAALDLAAYGLRPARAEVIAGRGAAALAGAELRVTVPRRLDFVWLRLRAAGPDVL